MKWSEERKAEFKKLWATDLTALAIATRMGISRNHATAQARAYGLPQKKTPHAGRKALRTSAHTDDFTFEDLYNY